MSRVERVSILVPCYGKPIRVKADKPEEISDWVKVDHYEIYQEMPKYEAKSMVCLFAYLPNTSRQWKILNNILKKCKCRVYVNEDGFHQCCQNMALMYKTGYPDKKTPVFGDVIIRTTMKQLEKEKCLDVLQWMPYAETRDEIEKSKELRMYMYDEDEEEESDEESDVEESDEE